MEKSKLFLTLGLLLSVGVAGFLLGYKELPLGGGGQAERACQTSTSTRSLVNTTSRQVLATSSQRAFARISIDIATSTVIATSSINLAFNEDATVGAGTSTLLSSSTPHFIEFGRNTDFPYTGAVQGATDSGATTVFVTECVYFNP